MTPVDQAERLIRKGGHVHLLGIGGIGMAGLAWLLKERGFSVSGCDLQQNRQTKWLAKNGVKIFSGHDVAHIMPSVDWVIRSTAVPLSHPEVEQALQCGLPVSRRGEVLPALMRDRICIAVSGTHGKTTTTAMIAQVLGCGYCVGGEISGIEGVACDGEIMVVEADESDGTVAGYTPDYSIITNIEYDHMEHHKSEEAFVSCFEQLIQNTAHKVFYCAGDSMA
ncbi:MAG TPA: Mur ligase domain-containing protein, partial [Pontiella sp.]